MSPGRQFEGLPENEPEEFFTKEKYPDLDDNLRAVMERTKRNLDAKNAADAAKRGELPLGGVSPKEPKTPLCGDCLVPTTETPILRRGQKPRIKRSCPKCGTTNILR